MSRDVTGFTLTEVARAIASKDLSSVEVTRACLEKIREWQPSRNCFIRIDEEAALAAARQCDRHLAAKGASIGPLHGVPLAHKDLFYRAGQVSTGGSEIRRNWRASTTSTLLSRLDAAGAIQMGTLNMSEFAANPTGHNPHYGDCKNAFDPRFISGGSSSGSATAVAARLAYASLGSDTSGSVRVPAAASGVVGLKPTYGRLSRYGTMARFWSLDHMGILARTAEDCARLLAVVAGADVNDPTTSNRPVPDYVELLRETSLEGLRVGVPASALPYEIDEEVRRALEESLKALTQLGARIVPVEIGEWRQLFRVADVIGKCESAAMHQAWMRKHPERYSPQVFSRLEAGLFVPATQYIDALRVRRHLTAEFCDTTMKGIDILHLPVMSCTVPTLEASEVKLGENTADEVRKLIERMCGFTRPINFLGLPAVSVPCGFCRNGLPIAFQLVGFPFDEGRLLQVAHAFQGVSDFHAREPSLNPPGVAS